MKQIGKLLMVLFLFFIPINAEAQNKRTQLLFARHTVNETGFQITDDAPAMAAALRERAGGEVTQGIIIMYSRHTVTRRHEIRSTRRYISFLNRFGLRPTFWRRDSTVRWSRRRAAWLRIYDRAGRILRGEVRSECEATPEHWSTGSRLARRARRNGYVRVDCGDTLNDFWRRM